MQFTEHNHQHFLYVFRKDRKALEMTQLSLEQVEASLQKEKSIVTEQKKYLENVKSLARYVFDLIKIQRSDKIPFM